MPQVLIVELGSQYTQSIGRTLRELGFRSLILPPDRAATWLAKHSEVVRGIILSGGYASTYDAEMPAIPEEVLAIQKPILGICLGHQYLATKLGGKVQQVSEQQGYSDEEIEILEPGDPLFRHVTRRQNTVWMSHGDSVTTLPPGFRRTARGEHCPVAAMSTEDGLRFGVQFHPEVVETECGKEVFRGFLEHCRAERDWSNENQITAIEDDIRAAVPEDTECLLGYSGGKDSSLLAALLGRVLGKRSHLLAIDHGALRKDEDKEIIANAGSLGYANDLWNFRIVYARDRFIPLMHAAGIDSEVKRKAFQPEYALTLAKEAARIGAPMVAQGTLNTDLIESGRRGGAIIKTHHNTGLKIPILNHHPLAEQLRRQGHEFLPQIHPLQELFKYEVEALARALGLPVGIVERKPFPGPGLFCRIFGISATWELIETDRWATYVIEGIMSETGFDKEYSQLVVGLDGSKTTGVKGDKRAYGHAIVYHPLRTADFMTGYGVEVPVDIRRRIKREITQHPDLVRVWSDEMNKPPATTEFE